MPNSAWAIVQYKDKILLLQRGKKMNNPLLWNLPGGGIEKNEINDIKGGVVRELWEEAGIRVPKSKVVFRKRITSGKRVMFFYHVLMDTKPTVKIDFESKTFKWLKLKDFPNKNKLHFQTAKFVQYAPMLLGLEESEGKETASNLEKALKTIANFSNNEMGYRKGKK